MVPPTGWSSPSAVRWSVELQRPSHVERAQHSKQQQHDERGVRGVADRSPTDFQSLWNDSATLSRERKRMLSCMVEDVTLVKHAAAGTITIHVRFKGGRTETLTTLNPKSSAQQVKTPEEIVSLVDKLLDDHIYAEIADRLNELGFRPGGNARRGREAKRFTAKLVAYIKNSYGLRSRYDRLRARGMLTREEMAKRLEVHEHTVTRWASHDIIKKHAYDGYRYLYEDPGPNVPPKHCSRWDRLTDRRATMQRRDQSQGATVDR